jgi:hypothetical protein
MPVGGMGGRGWVAHPQIAVRTTTAQRLRGLITLRVEDHFGIVVASRRPVDVWADGMPARRRFVHCLLLTVAASGAGKVVTL